MTDPKRIYSPRIRGGIDIHLHTAPDVLPRSVDDYGAVETAAEAGMRGIVLKTHLGSTAERATLVAARTGFTVLGSIALNRFIGGLNPLALESALRLGVRLVWMPTLHAQHHLDADPNPGPLLRALSPPDGLGITVLDERGNLSEAAEGILRQVAASGVALATGHLAPRETAVIVRRARELDIRSISITHPLSWMVSMAPSLLERLVKEFDVFAEFPYVDATSSAKIQVSVEEMGRVMRRIGLEHAILSSDGGQQSNPPPAAMLSRFAEELSECGFTDDEIHRIVAVNPAKLLGLDP